MKADLGPPGHMVVGGGQLSKGQMIWAKARQGAQIDLNLEMVNQTDQKVLETQLGTGLLTTVTDYEALDKSLPCIPPPAREKGEQSAAMTIKRPILG